MVLFFTMHEILHTYRFWVFDEKTPSLLFMLREEEFSFIATIPSVLMKNIQTSWKYLPKLHPENQYCIPFLCHMQNDVWCLCYAKWCDDVMLCEVMLIPKIQTHPCNKTWFFYKPLLGASSPFTSAESALNFRCKPPLGASSPFTSAKSALTFRCKLCIPLGTTFELLLVLFSFFFALDGAFSAFTFTSLGDIALIEMK